MTFAATLALCLVSAAPSEDVLIGFTSESCPHCRSMEPTLRRLAAAGRKIERIDVAARPDLARQFQVTGVPCFVLWSGDKAVSRVEGPTSYDRLEQLFMTAKPPLADRFTPPPPLSPSMAPPPRGPSSPTARGPTPEADLGGADPTTNDPHAAAERALRSTVRLRVEDASGTSVGSGTIIDVHGDEALVITCGHLFRELRRGGRILVDLFLPGAGQPVVAQLLDFDLERDIAVVSIRPSMPVQAARVGPANYRPAPGDAVVSIGCDRGAAPSIRPSRVTAVDRYRGSPNIEVAGAPTDGRSGGGLFTADGLLIGVCNAADPQDNEGIYAGLGTVQWQLESIGQRRLFAPPTAAPSAILAATMPPGTSATATAAAPTTSPEFANSVGPAAAVIARGQSPENPRAANDAAHPSPPGEEDLELICIVRPRQGSGDRHETIVIPRPSADLMLKLWREAHPSPNSPAPAPKPVIRGPTSR